MEDILKGKNLNLTFHGIGEFNNQVLYVKMIEEDQKMLNRIVGKYNTLFSITFINQFVESISSSKHWPKPLCTAVMCCLSSHLLSFLIVKYEAINWVPAKQ